MAETVAPMENFQIQSSKKVRFEIDFPLFSFAFLTNVLYYYEIYSICVVNSDENKAETEVTLLSAERVKVAAKAGLAAAATKAKLFADHEEREIQRLSANIINHQV